MNRLKNISKRFPVKMLGISLLLLTLCLTGCSSREDKNANPAGTNAGTTADANASTQPDQSEPETGTAASPAETEEVSMADDANPANASEASGATDPATDTDSKNAQTEAAKKEPLQDGN